MFASRLARSLGRGLAAAAGGVSVVGWLAHDERTTQCLSIWPSWASAPASSAPASHTPDGDAPYRLKSGHQTRDGAELLARYNLHEELGRGKFGVVQRATHRKSGTQVAIKMLPKKQGLVGERATQAALKEVELMRAVFWHPHIVNLRESFETETHHILVMDIAQGGELFDAIVEFGSYSEADASEVMRYVMSAVAHCHERGVAHRDLKPENIMLASKESMVDVLLCDFGLADRKLSPSAPLTGKAGTVGYTAPEMLVPEPSYGLAVDIFSLGVILYILLGGSHPFDPDCSADDETVNERVRAGKWGFTDSSWSAVSESAKGLLRQLLATNTAERISAEEALGHPWLKGEAASERPLLRSAARLAAFNDARGAWRRATKAVINREGLSESDRQVALAAAFKLIDSDGNGHISSQELTAFLLKIEASATPEEIARMLANADVDGDGNISMEEFVAMNM
jgi:calcium-dependent protein kinase